MTKQFDTLIYIGRFQPMHNAHLEIIRQATLLARQVVVIVGSADQPRTYKNPFTSAERELILQSACASIGDRDTAIHFARNVDSPYNDQAWAIRIQEIVKKYTYGVGKIGIIGHNKDESTFYLNMFPQWERVEVPLIEPLNATDIRELYFRRDVNMNFVRGVVPRVVAVFLENFMKTSEFEAVVSEREFIEKYRKQFSGLAYPPIFVTVDAVLIQSGHILLVKRGAMPGVGLWALPGGFVNAYTDRSVESAMLRELREETGLKVPVPVLSGSIKGRHVFDAVDRSARGRTITHAFKIMLPDGPLPKVKGVSQGNADAECDAIKAEFVPIADVKREECFEDHYDIIQHFVGA